MKEGTVRSFRDLIVWQKAMAMVEVVYGLTKRLPKAEVFALGLQMRRAAVSVPSNIAEGFGRTTKRDYAHFLSVAKGSVYELQTQTILCERINYLSEVEIQPVLELLDEIGKMLNSMMTKLSPPPPSPKP